MSSHRKILIFENSYSLTNYLVKQRLTIAHHSIEQHGRFTVALSGGTTPIEFYSKLSGIQEAGIWPKTHVFLVDERFVPLTDQDSNFRMIKENLLSYINILPGNIHPIPTDSKTVEVAAEEYKNILTQFFDLTRNGLPRFDLILLGIGEDGHTGSLFSDLPGIDDQARLTLPVSLNHLKTERVSLTLPVINNALHVIFFVRGPKKADIIKRVIEQDKNLPSARVRPTDGELIFLLDQPSAQKLSFQDSYVHDGEAIELILPASSEIEGRVS